MDNTTRISAIDLIAATPWAIAPGMLDTIRSIALRENESIDALEARLGRPLQNARSVSMREDVAVVPITGPIFRYANLFTQISGATSIELLAKDFTTALDDPAVSAIVLDINSPGGQVTGIAEFAQMVRQAGKPVVAYVDGIAASAAYWIAAAADEIVMSKNAMAGNVGAVMSLDMRKDPNKAEIVSSQSPNKRPDITTDDGRAQLQRLVDAQAQVFIDDVAMLRGMTPESVIENWNGGEMFIAAQAISLGMADRIGMMEDVIAGLAGKKKPANPSSMKGPMMTLEELRAAHPELCAALVEEGRTAGLAAGAEQERSRIQAVQAQTLPGHEALITTLMWDGKTTGPEAAVAVLAAERAVCAGRAQDIGRDAPAPVPHAPAPEDSDAAAEAGLSLDERCKARWDRDEKVRGEFASLADYTAFARAESQNKIRILGRKQA